MKRKYLIAYFSILLAIIAVFLYQGSRTKKDFFQNGGFIRQYKDVPYVFSGVKRAFWSFTKFGGEDSKGYYIFEKGSNRFQKISKDSDSLQIIPIENPRILQNQQEQYFILNDTLYNFNSKEKICRKFAMSGSGQQFDSIAFTAQAISPSITAGGNILYKSLVPKQSNFCINISKGDGSTSSNSKLFANGISMSDDGIIQPYLDGFVYVCMYRNEVRMLDSSLLSKSVYHTIDTVKSSPQVIDLLNGRTTYKTQPTFANRANFVKGDFLYIYSGIFADNDRGVSSFDTLILDTYNLKNGFRYSHSLKFSMPAGIKSIPGSFILSKKAMIVLMLDGNVLKYNFIKNI